MYLVGGPVDGVEVSNHFPPHIQVDFDSPGNGLVTTGEIILYTQRKWISRWPVPGWEPMVIEPIEYSYDLGPHPEVYWRIRNWYHPDRIHEIEMLGARTHWMEEVALAFAHGEMDYVREYMKEALAEAKRVSEITTPRRPGVTIPQLREERAHERDQDHHSRLHVHPPAE